MTKPREFLAWEVAEGIQLFNIDADRKFVTLEQYQSALDEVERLRGVVKNQHEELIDWSEASERYRKLLVEFADYENQNPPERCCWPVNEYMKKAREALARKDG